ncbi:hypothetical protein BC833DRAFT_418937 [Globomyces pollinis-pini]|nr:hypothetical protein BC833DRAFT_418937 [Globomyces pollinis-pini]
MEIPIENALDKLSIGQTIEAIDATPNIQRCLPRNIPIQKITLVQDLIESPKSNRSHTSTPDEEKNKSVSSICSHSPIPISTPTEEEKHERVTSTHSDSPIPQTADSKLNIKYYSFHIDKRSSLGKLREKKKSTSILKLTKVQSFKKNIHPLYFGDRPPTEYVVSQRDRFFRNQDNIFNSKIRSSASKWPIRLSTHSSNSISKSNIISGSGKLSFTNEVQTGLKKEESAKFDTEDSALSFLIPEASNYRIEMGTLIGQGGYGKVAPLKEIKPKGNSRSNRISRSPQGNGPHKAAKKAAAALEREMLLLSGLEHENIVKFIGIDILYIDHRV